jgi:glycine cleavage system H protein
MDFPAERRYTKEHEWVLLGGTTATVGVTEYAVDLLGDIVYVELPDVGAAVVAGEVCGQIESTKSVSDLFSPVTGTVSEVNTALADTPEAVGTSPYDGGWLFRAEVSDTGALLDEAAYRALIADSQQ